MAGEQYTIVVLSSSPPVPDVYSPQYAAPARRVAMPPSSPFALSPPLSPRKAASGALISGSRAAPIPKTVTRGFATAGSLVRSEHFAQQLDDESTHVQHAHSRRGSLGDSLESTENATKPRKRATKKTTSLGDEESKPKSRARKPKPDKKADAEDTVPRDAHGLRVPRITKSPFFETANAQPTIEDPTEPAAQAPQLTKAGKPRKVRAKKETRGSGDAEVKPKRTRATKPKVAAETCKKASWEDADAVSPHLSTENNQGSNTTRTPGAAYGTESGPATIWDVPQSPQPLEQPPPQQSRLAPLTEPLDLEEAVSRRRDWTPPRDTIAGSPLTVSTGKENRPSTQDARTNVFTHLISNFTYESPSSKATAKTPKLSANPGVTKRRRVELVELPGVQTTSRASSPEKGKAPKKKPRTITDLVTGQYTSKFADMDLQATDSDFFSPRISTTKVSLNDVAEEAPQKKPSRNRSRSKDNPESVTTKAKPRARKATAKALAKTKPVAEKLLSPTSAVSRLNKQEVLFGTSSQLALEESPTTVRQIQQALVVSEHDTGEFPHLLLEAPPRWPKLRKTEGKRSLWRESTRDGDGGLLEDLENVYIPEPDRAQDLPLLMDVAHEEPNQSPDFEDIDEFDRPAPITISSDLPTPPRTTLQQQMTQSARTEQTFNRVFDDIDDFNHDPPPSNQHAESQTSFADIDDFLSAPSTTSRRSPSHLLGPSVAAPTIAVAIVTPKKRGRPSKARHVPNVTDSAPPRLHEPPLPRQISRGLSATSPESSRRFVDIDEILDSEDEVLGSFSPTPPRIRRLQDTLSLRLTFDPPPSALNTFEADMAAPTPVVRIHASQLDWANLRPTICTAITQHIRSLSPTTDPKRPNWYEKILMYDPIVLEDFTTYLNSSTKLRTYRRATQKQIKAHNNGLKKKGNAILGVDQDGQVLGVEKELEVYMVRDWCQEMSICCIHAKESRGRGSARKGFY